MRSLNTRFLLKLSLFAALVAGVVHLAHHLQLARSAGILLSQADKKQAAGELSGAIQYLDRYLKLVPGDDEALARLALILAETRRDLPAFFQLQEAIRRQPDRFDLRREFVTVAMRLGRYAEARQQLEEHLVESQPEDSSLFDLLGRCQAAANAPEEAAKAAASFRRALELDPSAIATYGRLAHLLRTQLEQPAAADGVMNGLVRENGKVADAWVERARYRHRFSLLGALDDAKRGLEISPDAADALLLAADISREQGQLDQARAYLRRGIELRLTEARWYLQLAHIELDANAPDKAITAFRQGLTVVPDQPDLLWNLADTLISTGQVEDAKQLIERLSQAQAFVLPTGYLTARIAIVDKRWKDAANQLGGVRATLTNWPDLTKQADYWLGRCHDQLGNRDIALASFRRAVEADRRWLPARLGLGRALLQVGRVDEAIEEYRYVTSLPKAPATAWTQLARLMLLKQLRLDPKNRSWKPVEQVIQSLEQALPNLADVPILRAEILVAQDNFEQAVELVEAARKQDPKQLRLWLALTALEIRRENWERAGQLLAETQQQLGDHVELQLARIRYLVLAQGKNAAGQLLQIESGLAKFDAAEQVRLRTVLGLALRVVDRTADAARVWDDAAAAEPDNLAIRMMLFDAALALGDADRMEQGLAEIGRLEGEKKSAVWHYGQAIRLLLLARKGEDVSLESARAHLIEARVQRPRWSRVPLVESRIDRLEDDLSASAEHLLEAIHKGEDRLEVIREAVGLLYQQGRYVEADQVLHRLDERLTPFSAEMGRLVSEVSARVQDFSRAVAFAQAAAADSEDFRDHVWLGQLLGATDKAAEAEKALRHAVDLAPEQPAVWVALVRHLARFNNEQLATTALDQARERIEDDALPLVLAQCYEALGQRQQATEYYETVAAKASSAAVLRQATDFFLRTVQPRKAAPLLKQLVDGELQATEKDIAWARRNLAIVVASTGNYQGFLKAMELLDKNLAATPAGEEDRRAKAIVLATRPERSRRQEAIRNFERLVEKGQVRHTDRFLLFKLYQQEKRWPQARRQMIQLLASNTENVTYISAYVRALFGHGELELGEAELWIARLQELQPKSVRSLGLRARFLVKDKQLEAAMRLLDELAQRASSKDPVPDDAEPVTLASVARLAEGLVNDAQSEDARIQLQAFAERTFRQYAQQAEAEGVLLGDFLARQGKVSEALAVYRDYWQGTHLEHVASQAVSLLASKELSPQEIDEIGTRILSAVESRPKSSSLRLVLAELHDSRGQYDQAQAAYSQVPPGTLAYVRALNNHALLLALRNTDSKRALQLINRALDIAGPNANLLDSRGMIYLALGRIDLAKQDFAAALDNGAGATTHFHHAQACLLQGQSEAVAAALTQAHALGFTPESLHPLERAVYKELLSRMQLLSQN